MSMQPINHRNEGTKKISLRQRWNRLLEQMAAIIRQETSAGRTWGMLELNGKGEPAEARTV